MRNLNKILFFLICVSAGIAQIRSLNGSLNTSQKLTVGYDDTASYFRWSVSDGVHTLYIPYNLSPTIDTGGISSLNGLVQSTQTLAIDTTGAGIPSWSSIASTHTLGIPFKRMKDTSFQSLIPVVLNATQVVTSPKYYTARQYLSSAAVDTIVSRSGSGVIYAHNSDLYTTGGLGFYSSGDVSARNVLYRGGTDFSILRNYNNQYTVLQLWSPSGEIGSTEREATLSLVRGNEPNQEYFDLYNNGYSTETQHGIRIQKRGTGQYRDFIFDQYDGSTKTPIMALKSNRNVGIGLTTGVDSNLTVNQGVWIKGGLRTEGANYFTSETNFISRFYGTSAAIDTFIAKNSGNKIYLRDSVDINGSVKIGNLTSSRVVVTNASNILTSSTTTATEIGYVSGVTSAIQTQLDSKADKGIFETDSNGDLQPSIAGVYDNLYELDANSDIQPKL